MEETPERPEEAGEDRIQERDREQPEKDATPEDVTERQEEDGSEGGRTPPDDISERSD